VLVQERDIRHTPNVAIGQLYAGGFVKKKTVGQIEAQVTVHFGSLLSWQLSQFLYRSRIVHIAVCQFWQIMAFGRFGTSFFFSMTEKSGIRSILSERSLLFLEIDSIIFSSFLL
jgi:hypothetical protein